MTHMEGQLKGALRWGRSLRDLSAGPIGGRYWPLRLSAETAMKHKPGLAMFIAATALAA